MAQGTLSVVRMKFPQSLVPVDWKIVEDVAPQRGEIDLELVEILKSGEGCINGEEMVWRARGTLNANLGLDDSEIVLRNQHLLPEDYRSFYIPFPGTVLGDQAGRRRVAFLYFGDVQWHRHFPFFSQDFYGYVRLLRPRQ